MKRCTKCKQLKPKSEFYKHKGTKDGLYTRCKICHIESVKRWSMKNRGYANRINRRWYERNRDIIQENRLIMKKEHPEIRKAHGKVQTAINNGTLKRPNICSRCNRKTTNIISHHESYDEDKWLDVTWLCVRCHYERHDEINNHNKIPSCMSKNMSSSSR